MREEITEPLHWRTKTQKNASWTSTRRRSEQRTNLAAEAVDAAFAEEPASDNAEPASDNTEPASDDSCANAQASADILTSLSSQLTLLEAQREHLQKLLAQAKKS